MYLVLSTSLNPDSRSRTLATAAAAALAARQQPCELIDLQQCPLPPCDGGNCYGDPQVRWLAERIRAASGVLLASPIYNYDMAASAKNLIEVTGKAWSEKIVGFLVSAGGQGSWMSVMGMANSLMLDFRCLIIPRFVYVTESMMTSASPLDQAIVERIDRLAGDLVRLGEALARPDSQA